MVYSIVCLDFKGCSDIVIDFYLLVRFFLSLLIFLCSGLEFIFKWFILANVNIIFFTFYLAIIFSVQILNE